MTEACDINNFPPCGDMCPRVKYDGVPSTELVEIAGQYATFFAADAVGDIEGERVHRMTDKQFGVATSYENRKYMGGVSLCSGRISLDRCTSYIYDNGAHAIVSRRSGEALDAVQSAE